MNRFCPRFCPSWGKYYFPKFFGLRAQQADPEKSCVIETSNTSMLKHEERGDKMCLVCLRRIKIKRVVVIKDGFACCWELDNTWTVIVPHHNPSASIE